MKTVHTHVLSSDPISLSDATSFLSSFSTSAAAASSSTGSHETSWFVRRALASFDELYQLHRKLSGSHNDAVETHSPQQQSFVSSRDVSISKPENQRHDDASDTKAVEVKKEKKKKKKERQNNVDGIEGGIKEESSETRSESSKKKKRKSEVLENGEVDVSAEEQHEKKKKRRKS